MYYISLFVMAAAPVFKSLKNEKKIFERISDQIRESIFSGALKPGDKLPSEKELSNQFSTGRMVVREGLRTLEQSGLIYIKRGSTGGAFVKDPDATVISRSIEDLVKIGNVTQRQLTEARVGIELSVIEVAAEKRAAEDIALLEKSIEDCEAEIRRGGPAIEENLHFHVLLAKASQNSLFEMIVKSIMNVTGSFIQSFTPERRYVNRVLQDHREIFEAVKEQDVNQAKDKMRKHLLEVNRKHLSIAKENGLPVL